MEVNPWVLIGAEIALGQRLGISPAEIMGIGDSTNDLAMLKQVGGAIAVRNASAEVKAVATHVTLADLNLG